MKTPEGEWSPPCAVGLSGFGFGILAGIGAKDVVIFVMDEPTMKALFAKHGFKLGSQIEVTVGIGRAGMSQMEFTKESVGATFALAYTKGAFAGYVLSSVVHEAFAALLLTHRFCHQLVD